MAIFLNFERSDTLLNVAFSEESERAQKVANIFPRLVDGLVFYSIEG